MNKKILLWIAVPVTTLVIVITVLMLTRKENNKNNEVGNVSDQTQTNEVEEKQENFDVNNWGVADRCSARSDTSSESYIINFPRQAGSHAGYGVVAEQLDDTMAIISGQNRSSPKINNISELFPAYFEQLQFTLEGVNGILSDNYKFSLNSDKSVIVGDYNMHTFEGEFEFDNDDEHCKYQFVAYATTLKSNGAYAYWVVYDTSEDQSNGELIKEYAYKMARTFREEE